jgi:hypothetical protein
VLSRLPIPLLLVVASLPGLVALLLVLPEVPDVPRAALLINPTLLVIAAAFAGTAAARRSGLRLWSPASSLAARLLEWVTGVVLGVVIAAADHLGRGWWQVMPGGAPSVVAAWTPAALAVGVLYGGVAEEVIMRWGVMGVLTLALWRTIARAAPCPTRLVLSLAALLSALAFAVAHLPLLNLGGEGMTTGPVLRTLLLNSIAGLVYGWYYARRDLMAAMGAHAGTHLGFAAVAAFA